MKGDPAATLSVTTRVQKSYTGLFFLRPLKGEKNTTFLGIVAKSRYGCWCVSKGFIYQPCSEEKDFFVFKVLCSDLNLYGSKNRGKTPKMDGENHGKPYEQMDDLGG